MLFERFCNWSKKFQSSLSWYDCYGQPSSNITHVHVPSLSLCMQCDVPLSQRPLSYTSQLKCVLHTITGVYQVKGTLDEVRKEKAEGEMDRMEGEEGQEEEREVKSESHTIAA